MDTGIQNTKQALIVSSAERVQWRYIAAVAFALFAFMALLPMRASAAVTISSFTAKASAPNIEIKWSTATELNNSGFNLLRSTAQNGSYGKIAGLIPAKNPGSIIGASYSYNDSSVTAGQTYFYKLQAIESSGGTQQFGPVSAVVAQSASPTSAATSTRSPTAVPAATNTPAKVPSSTPAKLFTATPPASPVVGLTPAASGATPSPTNVAKVARAAATSTQDSGSTRGTQNLPTPAQTLVAMGVKQSTPEPDSSDVQIDTSATTGDDSSSRSYYFGRLITAGMVLTVFLSFMGALALGTLAIYYFMRPNLR